MDTSQKQFNGRPVAPTQDNPIAVPHSPCVFRWLKMRRGPERLGRLPRDEERKQGVMDLGVVEMILAAFAGRREPFQIPRESRTEVKDSIANSRSAREWAAET